MSVTLRVALLLALGFNVGCSYVSSAQPGLKSATGEAWYVSNSYFLFIPVSSNVYYCPADRPRQCTKATIVD